MTFNGRTATTGAMLVLFVGACIISTSLPSKAAFMPLLFGIPGVILCLWQLILDLRRAPDAPPDPTDEVPDDSRSELEVFVWLGLFSVALIGFGFVIGGPVIVTAFVRFSSRDSWKNALFAGAGTFAVIFGVFIWLLGLPMFQGLVLEALF
jgi:hypothetical protein